jgi:hypothetical protein
VEWICLASDRGKWGDVMSQIVSLGVTQNAANLNGGGTVSFSLRALLHGVR